MKNFTNFESNVSGLTRVCLGFVSGLSRFSLGEVAEKYGRYAAMMALLLTLACGNVWGAETVLFSSFSNDTESNYFKNYTVDSKTVTVATDRDISSSSGDYYVSLGSTPSNNGSNYIELSVSGATIKTVSVLITGNGSDKTCQPALLGWEGAIADNATADYVLVPSSRSISNKGLSNAEWHQFDVHGNDLTRVRIYRAVKGVNVAGESTSGTTYGNAQSLQFYGIRVELESSSSTHSVTYNGNGNTSGSVPVDSDSPYEKDATVTVLGNSGTLAKTGCIFNGWNTSNDGSGIHYDADDTFTMGTANVTLYAEWAYPATGTGTVTYVLSGSTTTGTVTGVSTINSLSSSFTTSTLSISSTKSGYTGDIVGTPASFSSTAYLDVQFTIADGYQFNPSSITVQANPLNNTGALMAKVEILDGTTTVASNELSCSKSTDNTVTFASGAFTGKNFKGTTHLRIYFWGPASDKKFYVKSPLTITGTVAEAASSDCDAYEFHYGTHDADDWETACFEQVGETNEWKIEDFTIPSTPNFYVGYHGDGTNGWNSTWSSERAWTDWPTKSDNKWQGQIFLAPNDGALGSFAVGQATGAVGTLTIHSNYNDLNKFLSFTPNGYGITYSGTGHAFTETATSNMYETDVVTLPDVSSITYTMGFQTATAGTYVTGIHSSAAENINAMGVTILDGGNKKILFNPVKNSDDYTTASAKIAIWDATNSAFYDFMTDTDADGILEGYVPSTCTSISIVRLNSDIDKSTLTNSASTYSAAWAKKWNQSTDISVGDLLKQYNFNGWCSGDNCKETFTSTSISPATSDKGKFRMWANSADQNWYVHFIPYYVLSYDANGGSGTTAATERNSESSTLTVSVAANGFTAPTGYSFNGWNTLAGGGGDSYAAGADYTLTANATLYALWTQTVTLKTGSQGSEADKTPTVVWQATSLTGFSAHTASGYTLQGYYTASTGGTKVLNADGSFAAAAVDGYITSSKWARTGSTTLYAQWRAAAGKTCYTWDAAETTPATGTTNYGGLYLTASNITKSQQVSSALTDTVYDVSDNGKRLTGHINGAVIDSLIFSASTSSSDYTTFVVSFCSTQTFDTAKIIKVGGYHCTVYNVPVNTADCTQIKIKAPTGTKSFVLGRNFMSDKLTSSASLSNSGKRYLYYIKACSASGGTHTISYNNGGGTGSIDDQTGIEDDGSRTLTTNSFTAPTNFAFAGWVADVNVTIGGSTVTAGTLISNGASLTNITSDIALTAVWSQTITLDDNDANHGATGDGSATVYYNATSLASITHTTAASGYKLSGYYTAATSGTKVLNSDGSFAGTDITDYIADGKWVQSTTSTPTLYAQYEASGSIKWNLQVNSADAPIVTSSKNSSYTQISTSNMTNLDSIGLNITASKKGGMTSKITAPTAFDKDKYMKVTFQVASGYQFKPSSIKVPIQPVDGGADVKLVLVDNAATPDSIGKEQASLAKGKLDTVEMTNSSAVFKGTVTLKIYCYGSSTGTYRLGTPIQIDGEIESTCTMPSYTSVSYSQTEYVLPASASAISVVGASGDPSYQWKYNSTGDRTSGTNCGTEASVTPSMESTGTLYYWCELTNACGTVKTPAVAITVSASKSTATVTWTDPSTPNYGGGGYTIKATVNEAWEDGNASDLIITAPAGIRIYDKTSGTTDSKKWVQVKFDVQTAFDRETYSSNIPFTVSADATTSYNAISIDHNLSYSACTGGGGSAEEELMPVDAAHIDNSTWKGAWVYEGIGMMRYGHGSSDVAAGKDNANLTALTYKMADDDVDTCYKSSANHFGFYTEKAITGVRLYVHTTNDEVTVSGVYVANSAYSTGTPSTGSVSFTAEYNDDNESLRSGTHSGSAWVDITFDKEVAAEKYGQINLSSNVRIAGIAFISASGSGASLTTTLAFATAGPIAATSSTPNFTNKARVTAYSETLGAITYSSNNTAASVNATTGEVSISAKETAQTVTITATLAASGCYKGATTTYTINVAADECSEPSGSIKLTGGSAVKCSTDSVTLTMTGFTSGATVQWYDSITTISDGDDYKITTSGTTSILKTIKPGIYSAIATSGCAAKRTNSITISNYSAEVAATKIVDKWYIKHGRVTPDIALWALDEGTHLDSVTWSTTNATGLTIADFYESDGVVYLSGKEPNTNESSDAEYTLTLRVKDECENKTLLNTSDKQITLTHQKNTDKHVLAFVVEGTAKGGFTAGISADQTTGVELYNEIAKTFDVQATNIYSTDDEQKLKEYYSQFDILCITDYPNTKTKGTNSKSYVDAIGAMVDIRPILTMEAWVSGLTNWKSKGISGTPKSPTTRQYSMLLQCKDHEIFSGTNPTTVGSGDETMYRIDMVDKTLEDYATLDATYGAGAHESDKNYQYGKKPALQGFTYDASMSSLLPIGRIDDGEGNDLEVGVERQAVMEARLLVLGINGYAMERLDDDGLTIVINALKYLMKKNAEDISDCSNYFVGGAEGDPYSWKNLDNWSGSSLPDRTQEVRIVAPCVISDTIARASSVKIVTGGTYSYGTKTANGSLTINPTGSLIVEGKIYSATAPNFFEQRATEPEDLVVEADVDKTGTLIFDNEDGETQATVKMYSKSYWEYNEETRKYVKYWSYVGMPIKDVHIPEYFYGAFTYYYNEAKGWEKRYDEDIMQPFEGIGLAMQEGNMETFEGTLVSTEDVDLPLSNTENYGEGDNLISNSWTAPIQIANFDAEDFGTAWASVYIFNTGKRGRTYVNATADNDGASTAGQWLGIPIGVAGLPEYTGLKVIPAMQGFLVHNDESATTTIHLDYDKLVRDGAASNTQINEPMRSPKQARPKKKKDVDGLLRIRVVGETTYTDVWMMQDARFSEAYDNGWDTYFSPGDNRSPKLYARSAAGNMAFLALPDLDGTVLGFAPSRDGNDYSFTFRYRGEDEYYLNDLKLQQSVLIDGENDYSFTFEKGDTNRFYISRTPLQAPQTPTGVEVLNSAAQSTKAIKVIYNDKLYIIRGGRVYGADGTLVK